ncbi:unnamed protein product [Brassica rapa subsp. trilocularis]
MHVPWLLSVLIPLPKETKSQKRSPGCVRSAYDCIRVAFDLRSGPAGLCS